MRKNDLRVLVICGVIMTAYTFNKPVVATSVGGIPEIVMDDVTGKLVPTKDPMALGCAITELLRDQKKINKMSKNIERIFSSGKFSWDYIAKQTFELYARTVSEFSH